MQIEHKVQSETAAAVRVQLLAQQNTWSHQRRHRRQQQHGQTSRQAEQRQHLKAGDTTNIEQSASDLVKTKEELKLAGKVEEGEKFSQAKEDEKLARAEVDSEKQVEEEDEKQADKNKDVRDSKRKTVSTKRKIDEEPRTVTKKVKWNADSNSDGGLELKKSIQKDPVKEREIQDCAMSDDFKHNSKGHRNAHGEDHIASFGQSSGQLLLFCEAVVNKQDEDVVLSMKSLEGGNKEAMHQIMQYVKNRLV